MLEKIIQELMKRKWIVIGMTALIITGGFLSQLLRAKKPINPNVPNDTPKTKSALEKRKNELTLQTHKLEQGIIDKTQEKKDRLNKVFKQRNK